MIRILEGHVLEVLRGLPAGSVHMCVTSPPYFGLRDYKIEPQVWGGADWCGKNPSGHVWGGEREIIRSGGAGKNTITGGINVADFSFRSTRGAFCRRCGAWRGSLGLEPTPELYLEHMVEVCREIRRVLRKDGTFWLNISDSYAGSWGAQGRRELPETISRHQIDNHPKTESQTGLIRAPGLKPKDLMLIPARLVLRLQEDGWWIRSEIVWAKPAPMPESVTDRPTCAHEKVFLLTKSKTYFYDAEAVKEDSIDDPGKSRGGSLSRFGRKEDLISANAHRGEREYASNGKRNLRNVWSLPPAPFPEAHFATFPPELPRRAILAGTSAKGVCLTCGAPWARVTKTSGGESPFRTGAAYRRGGEVVSPSHPRETETLGWQPTCACKLICRMPEKCGVEGEDICQSCQNPIPGTVLDPFLGSGTTAIVADQLRRDCIGIELSPKYVEMAKRRIVEDAGFFAEVAE